MRLDATSLAAGNTINAATGTVTYVAGWSGTSTITAQATGSEPQHRQIMWQPPMIL